MRQTTQEFIDHIRKLRADLMVWEQQIIKLKQQGPLADSLPRQPSEPGENLVECVANIMLAYRHLEDCRMRLGKAIQAVDGGVSVYDKPQPPKP